MGVKLIQTVAMLLALSALSACVHRPQESCGASIMNFDAISQAKVVLLGEIHGTQQIPQFAGDTVCSLVKLRRQVILALEIPRNEQERIDAYLDSGGDSAARHALVESDFWRKTLDGRATVAMANLIEHVRSLKSAGAKVSIVALDNGWGAASQPGTRDEVMASAVGEAIKRLGPRGVVVVLAGNVHTARVEKFPDFPVDTPMGYLLKTDGVIAFDGSIDGGTASTYGAVPTGRVFHKSHSGSPTEVRAFTRFSQPDDRGYSGTFHVGRISASPHVAK